MVENAPTVPAKAVSGKPLNTGKAWPVLFAVWFAGFCAPANMAKVTTLAPLLMEVFGITESGVGWVIAVFYILGVIIAFPAAAIVKKLGLRNVIILALACGIAGGLVGVLSTNLIIFMVSRVIEGAGMGLMAVCGAAAIGPWFPDSKKGLPLSIWALWVSVPTIILPPVYSALSEMTGTWTASWWFMLALCVVALVLFLVLYTEPNFTWGEDEQPVLRTDDVPLEEETTGAVRLAFKTPAFWALMVIILIDGIGFMAVNGFLTTYIVAEVGASLGEAALIVSAGAIIGALAGPISGAISDKIHSRKILLLIALICAVVFMWFVFSVDTVEAYYPLVFIQGIYCGVVGAMTWTIASEILPDDAIAGSTAGMSFFQNGGFFIGAMSFGMLLEAMGGWGSAMHMVIVPGYILAIIVLLIFWKKMP